MTKKKYTAPGLKEEQEGLSESIIYTGSSMNPLMKNADTLRFIPYRDKKIRPGDIVVFAIPKSQYKIIHRVTSVSSQGIRTRGDNRKKEDPWVLSPDAVLGRVVSFQRKNRVRKVIGGPRGQLIFLAVRTFLALKSALFFLFRPLYSWLSQTGVLRRLIPLQKSTRIIALTRPYGTELQLLLGRRVIGRLLPLGDGWQIRKPFRLFIDETSIPKEVKNEE